MRINVHNCVLVLVYATTFLVSCNGFFWNSQPQESQMKQMPMSYFRTYTYHPLTVQTSYPASYRVMQTSQSVPMNYVAKSVPGTFSAQTILAPTNFVPQPQVQSQPMMPQMQQASSNIQPQTQNIDLNSIPTPTQYTAQQIPQPQALPLRQNTFFHDNYNYAYNPPSPQMNMQQVQFVPCMCPVTVSMAGDGTSAEKRADDGLLSAAIESQPNLEVSPENKL